MPDNVPDFTEPELRFFTPREQFRSAEKEYDEVSDCVFALPMVQADHEAQRTGCI